MKKLCVVGLGYIGLPTAILASQEGYDVCGYDVDQLKVENINNGEATIIEPEIAQRLHVVLNNKKFKAVSKLQASDCFLIAVPTPFMLNKQADLSYVFDAGNQISKVLKPGNLVILESTVPVGATEQLSRLLEKQSGLKLAIDFFVAHCPERVLPGKVFKELVLNDRVIGGVCSGSAHMAKYFYSKFVKGKLYLTNDKTAEMVKLVENSSRDIQIALANQIDAMCKKVNISSHEVIEFANKHPRVNILNPGCGVGGHCIAVDPWFLVQSFPNNSQLLKTARYINDDKPNQVIKSVVNAANEIKRKSERPAKVLAFGLTFKPNIDDMRQSPAIKICKELNKKNDLLELAVCEPNVSVDAIEQIGFNLVKSIEIGVQWADIILILVGHKEFASLKSLDVKNQVIVDTCGLLYESKEGQITDAQLKNGSNLQARI